jgi:polysaccharide deacetylase 2 family uncharacterized protein YibQ
MRIKILLVTFILTTLLLALLIGLRFNYLSTFVDTLAQKFLSDKTGDTRKLTEKNFQSTTSDVILQSLYTQLEIKPESVKRTFTPDDSLLVISIEVPRGKPMEWIIWLFTSSLGKTGYTVDNCTFISEDRGCNIFLSPKKRSMPKLSIKIARGKTYYSRTAKLAVIIEDFHFNADQSTIDILSFSEPLTLSMRAEKKLATSTAQIANEYKKEIVILQPMEPVPGTEPANQVIMVHYPEDKIRSILRESVQNMPLFKGYCNFHGSRVLEDSHVMSIICDEIKKQNCYLIVSMDSRKSVAASVAHTTNIPFSEIDYEFTTSQKITGITDSLRHCAVLAQKRGSLLIKGQPTAPFIEALKQSMQIFQDNGIQFVYVSELINSTKNLGSSSEIEGNNETGSGK